MIKTFKHITILLLLLSNNQAAAFYHHVSQSPLSFVRRHSCCHRSRGTSIIWRWHWYQHLLLILQQRHSSSSLISCLPSQAGSSSDEFESSNNCNIQGEIIGSTGRIGSFLLRSAATSSTPSSTESIFAIIAKGERPGLSSPINTPIYVAIPATLVTRVIEQTIPSRRQDLVFVTNGIPSNFIQCFRNLNEDDDYSITTTVPHFGVLKVGADPISSKSSPPTFIHGKHSAKLQFILESYDLNVKVTSNVMEIDAAAIRKLIWVSGMWLLCHDNNVDNVSINVTQVHETKFEQLHELVRHELYPASLELLQRYHHDNDEITSLDDAIEIMGSVEDVMSYLKSYSYSMPGAIPNKVLAIDEIDQRNGILLSTSIDQPLHRALIERVTTS